MAQRSLAVTVAALSALIAVALWPEKGDVQAMEAPAHKPSAICTDADLEEHVITDLLDNEPSRPHVIATGYAVEVFKWNMKWAFDIDINADTIYVVQAMTPGSKELHVHVFTVQNHCITYYKLTWGSVIAEMFREDAWERGNPHVDGQTDRPVPANRPVRPAA